MQETSGRQEGTQVGGKGQIMRPQAPTHCWETTGKKGGQIESKWERSGKRRPNQATQGANTMLENHKGEKGGQIENKWDTIGRQVEDNSQITRPKAPAKAGKQEGTKRKPNRRQVGDKWKTSRETHGRQSQIMQPKETPQ